MKYLLSILLSAFVISFAHGQRPDEVLATSTGATYLASSLSPDAQKLYFDQRKVLGEARADLLSHMIDDAVLEIESKALGTTPEKLLAGERAKVAEPTAASILEVYNANKTTLGGQSLEAVRPQIVEFLKHNAEHKRADSFIQSLRTKHKVVIGKDVNAIGLAPADVLVTIGTRNITLREFEQANRVRLNDAEMSISERLKSDLEASILSALAAEEAKARNLDTSSFIAAEITDKLRSFTEEERAGIESDLMRRLFAKYNVKVLLREPAPLVHSVSIDDDPQTGSATAPVTVVMFTDFQCSACS